ncbi:MAG: N-acetylmuramoyl-L-alanine amidase, partial [Sphaerochaetaceae bacterium]|nr:N-acetylmuramoyl-L-alanine amidase [Sphaerochaetaceae bacterium]
DQRAAIARTTDPGPNEQAVFISIHTNSIGIESVSGFEILIKSMNKKIQFFTSGIQGWQLLRYAKESDSQLNAALNRANTMLASAIRSSVTDMFPDMRDRGVKEQDVWVLNASAIPSVLVETSFISNEQDSNNMASSEWITAMAHAIAEGILNFVAIIQ